MKKKSGYPHNKTIYNRAKHDDNVLYTIINNTIINNKNLNLTEKGLILYILSQPDNYIVNKGEIIRESGLGRKAVDNAFTHLIELKYIERIYEHNIHTWIINECPDYYSQSDSTHLMALEYGELSDSTIVPASVCNEISDSTIIPAPVLNEFSGITNVTAKECNDLNDRQKATVPKFDGVSDSTNVTVPQYDELSTNKKVALPVYHESRPRTKVLAKKFNQSITSNNLNSDVNDDSSRNPEPIAKEHHKSSSTKVTSPDSNDLTDSPKATESMFNAIGDSTLVHVHEVNEVSNCTILPTPDHHVLSDKTVVPAPKHNDVNDGASVPAEKIQVKSTSTDAMAGKAIASEKIRDNNQTSSPTNGSPVEEKLDVNFAPDSLRLTELPEPEFTKCENDLALIISKSSKFSNLYKAQNYKDIDISDYSNTQIAHYLIEKEKGNIILNDNLRKYTFLRYLVNFSSTVEGSKLWQEFDNQCQQENMFEFRDKLDLIHGK